jgi:hypothetical protein
MSTDCLVCREVAGEIELPGGLQHLYPRYPGVPPDTSWLAVDELPHARTVMQARSPTS